MSDFISGCDGEVRVVEVKAWVGSGALEELSA
jgi:hypothetical protein